MSTTTFKNAMGISSRMEGVHILKVNNPTATYPRGTFTHAH